MKDQGIHDDEMQHSTIPTPLNKARTSLSNADTTAYDGNDDVDVDPSWSSLVEHADAVGVAIVVVIAVVDGEGNNFVQTPGCCFRSNFFLSRSSL